MNTRNILLMSLLAALCGCQPETPAQRAAAPAVSGAAVVAPVKQAKLAPAEKAAQPAAAEKPAQAAPVSAVATPHAAESGTAIKGDDLKAEPFRDAKTVAKLITGDKVDILNKDGGWLQVNSARGSGWVRMLSIRKGDVRKGSGDASGVLALASGRAGTGKVVATTGIRGLNEEELKAARFDAEELKRAESYATSKSEAAKFAASGKLAARTFNYLPAPK